MNMIKKYKFNSHDKLPSDKKIIACSVIRAVRAVFHENNTYYPQIFLDEGLHKLQIVQKFYVTIELTFLKELILIR